MVAGAKAPGRVPLVASHRRAADPVDTKEEGNPLEAEGQDNLWRAAVAAPVRRKMTAGKMSP